MDIYASLETSRFEDEHDEYDVLDFEVVMSTTRYSAILVVNRRTAALFHLTTILRTPSLTYSEFDHSKKSYA